MGDGVQKKYAIIINGDTESRHLANVDRAIDALKAEGDFEIHVASPRAPNSSVTQYLSPDDPQLQKIIAGLKGKIDDDDLLVVYVTGHGEKNEKDEGCVKLASSCFPLADLAKEMNALSFGQRIVVMDQCFSGGAMGLFAGLHTTVVTQGGNSEEVSCQLFSPYFWSAEVTDLDRDGIITVQERYAFALQKGNTPTLTQYFSSDSPISLSGKKDNTPSFSSTVLEVNHAHELQGQLKKLKPGELALVMFSADWCDPCKGYFPQFEALAKKYNGRFLMIHAEGVKGSEEEWGKFGVTDFPAVAFIDPRGKITPVKDRKDPLASLINASIQTLEDQVRFHQGRLSDPNPKVRIDAVKMIGEMGPAAKPALGDLIVLLKDRDVSVRKAAMAALGNLGELAAPAIPALEEFLKPDDYDLASEAALALAGIGEKASSAVPRIVRMYFGPGGSGYLRLHEALEKFGPKAGAALPELVKLLGSSDPQLRKAAAMTIGFMEAKAFPALPDLLKLFEDNDDSVQGYAVEAMANLGEKVPTMIPFVEEGLKSSKAKIRFASAYCLVMMGDSAYSSLSALIPLMKDSNPEVRSEAFFAVGRLAHASDSETVLPLLIRGLEDPSEEVRASAASILEEWVAKTTSRRSEIVAALQGKMKDPSAKVRVAAARSLGAFSREAETAVPSLIEALQDSAAEVRAACADSLGKVGKDHPSLRRLLLPALQKLFKDPKPEVRAAAAGSFKDWGLEGEPALPGLIDLLKDPEEKVRQAGLRTLLSWKGEAAPAFSPLLVSLTDASEECRELAAQVLGAIAKEKPEWVPSLAEKLKDPDPRVRRGVAKALYHAGPSAKEALPALIEALQDSDFQVIAFAAMALGDMGEAAVAALPRLMELTQHENYDVRYAAKEAVEKLKKIQASLPPKKNWFVGLAGGLKTQGLQTGGEVQFSAGLRPWESWEFRINFGAARISDGRSQEPSGTRLNFSAEPVYHLGKRSDRAEPLLFLPGVGIYHFIGSDESGFSLNPLGLGLQIHLNETFSIFSAMKPRIDIPFREDPKVKFGIDVPLGVAAEF